ncbi:DUF2520 domain-containing protein [Flavobacteriales bacterium]|jgi:predicted short-subunit dehydrogenase-like oxidoreductase (DUF2520 family)|nr:DUF2520 domain-containing protein [Flavobacteriales bacterium]MDG1348518.1 DUF2520 domain-containing protein [Flavobacteriales bacterium]
MKNIIFVGSGNVATHLGISLQKENYKVLQVYSRSVENAKKLAEKLSTDFTNDLTQLKTADLIIVSVKDDAISEVLSQLKDSAIVHTSGSIGMDVFNGNFSDCGVFYPLQTFNKEIDVNISEIPFCIEGNSKKFEKQLIGIAKTLSNNVVSMNSEQRKQLHIAAVFACNFSNQMFSIADDLLAEKNLDFEILLPLIKQTISKLDKNKPKDVQTGPAKRNDTSIIQEHINQIQNKEIKELYQKISSNILQTHE